MVTVSAEVRDATVARALESMRPGSWNRSGPVPIATMQRVGEARVTQVITDSRSTSARDVEITCEVAWGEGRGGTMDASIGGCFTSYGPASVGLPFLDRR